MRDQLANRVDFFVDDAGGFYHANDQSIAEEMRTVLSNDWLVLFEDGFEGVIVAARQYITDITLDQAEAMELAEDAMVESGRLETPITLNVT